MHVIKQSNSNNPKLRQPVMINIVCILGTSNPHTLSANICKSSPTTLHLNPAPSPYIGFTKSGATD